jgi:hypothetical protein
MDDTVQDNFKDMVDDNVVDDSTVNDAIKDNVEDSKIWQVSSISPYVHTDENGDEWVYDPDHNYFDLYLNPTYDELMKEFFWYIDQPKGNLRMYTSKNLIINTFQQEFMFRKERELWYDPAIRKKLIANRKKYLGENVKLTPTRILNGFKISGIHRGYSGFNPLIVQWFVEHYNLQHKVCYDPCGGWGHRVLIGGNFFSAQIYNDLSKEILTKVDDMAAYFGIPNVEFHNHDCRTWEPERDFDVIFTCPPYYNIEDYGHDKFKSRKDFANFLDCILKTYETRESCKICGLVMKDDLMHRTDYIDKFAMIKHQCHFNKEASKESLFVWRKES